MIILQQARGLLSSNDQLSLDLPFAATKSLAARVGPTPVFTRASTATFIGSNGLIQSAAANEPRFEHDPLTGVCGGLLLEQSRTNQIRHSEDLGTTWSLTNATASLNVATAPDGSTSADKLINNNGAAGRAQQLFTLSGSNVYSVFAKESEWGWVYIAPLQATGGVWFNLTNGTIGTQQAGFVGSITSFGNGWYRCAVQFTGTSTSLTARIHATNADNTLTVGDGTSGILIWGAQLEAGATATSYIPTTAGTVVRSQDLCTITGAAFTGMYNQTEGSIFCAVTAVGATNATSAVYGIQAPIRSNGNVLAEFTSTLFRSQVTSTTFTSQALFQTTASRNVLVKNAVALRTDDFANSCNGNITTDTSGTLPATMDRFVIGATGNSGGPQVGNNIFSSIKYYRKRLSNAKLQALTA